MSNSLDQTIQLFSMMARRDRVCCVTVAYCVVACQDMSPCLRLRGIEDSIETLDISDFHMLWYNVIMAHLLYESMFLSRFKENSMPKDKATYQIELEKDMMSFLEQMTTQYDLPDVSKAVRCLVDYALCVETARDDIFAEIRCNRCD